jgi:hypothetical protein
MNNAARLALAVTIVATAIPLSSPTLAQSGWIDITKEVAKVIGSKSADTTYYLKSNSVRNVKSVNLRGVTYREAIFSFVWSGTTSRQTYSFNCSEYSYKMNSQAPGYWFNLEWIAPGYDKTSFSWFVFKYLCGDKPDPWGLVSESVDGEKLYLNQKAAYRLSLAKHGSVYTFVGAFIQSKRGVANDERSQGQIQWPGMPKFQEGGDIDGATDLRRVYVACKTKSIGIYSLADAAGDEGILLEEANPGSVASGILETVCR